MRVELLTLQCIKNYGSVLQTYATQQILRNYFNDVETLNYIRNDSADENMMEEWVKSSKGIAKRGKAMLLYPLCKRYQHVFNSFLAKNVRLSKKVYRNDADFIRNMPIADAYCVGSDQVWNSSWNQGILPAMFLKFAPDNKLKFSFSSSIGKTKIEPMEEIEMKMYLERFQYISVRESSAVELLQRMDIQSVHLLDPTLLLPREVWIDKSSERLEKENYVLVYQLNPNKEFDQYAKRFAKKKNLKLVHIALRYKDLIKSGRVFLMPEVEEFLSLIRYAEYVITDSFHGTAFSINFNRELVVIYPDAFSTRLASILEWAGLTSRHLTDYEDFSIADVPINYVVITQKLVAERKNGNDYLKRLGHV